ncbi:MAG: FAD-dependent monooxygenase [Pseudomonadota bacterium]
MKILIAGGGIAGLTTALCFAWRGAEVTVVEQAETFGEVGAGLQLSPNAMKVMRWLGLEEQLASSGFAPEFAEMRMGESGQQIFKFPLAHRNAAQQRWGAPYLHIHRADLIECLLTALGTEPRVSWMTGDSAASYQQDGDTVTLRLVSGKTLVSDLLIGADGIHSTIRTQMLGPEEPRCTGNTAWRCTIPTDLLGSHAPDPNATIWLGRGKHAVTYRLRGGQLANFVGVVERSDWQSESWSEEGDKAEALADFADWHPVVQSLIEAAPRLFRWGLFDRAPLSKWTDGRVAIIGDAAHPMLPFMAQGAGQAIEDAFVLARNVMGQNPTEDALKNYEAERKPRASRVQSVSRGNAKLFHHRNGAMRLATYGPMWMAGRFAPGAIMARQDWLYGHDVVA